MSGEYERPEVVRVGVLGVCVEYGIGTTGWRTFIGCLKLHVSFHKKANTYRAVLWKITDKDGTSYASSQLRTLTPLLFTIPHSHPSPLRHPVHSPLSLEPPSMAVVEHGMGWL